MYLKRKWTNKGKFNPPPTPHYLWLSALHRDRVYAMVRNCKHQSLSAKCTRSCLSKILSRNIEKLCQPWETKELVKKKKKKKKKVTKGHSPQPCKKYTYCNSIIHKYLDHVQSDLRHSSSQYSKRNFLLEGNRGVHGIFKSVTIQRGYYGGTSLYFHCTIKTIIYSYPASTHYFIRSGLILNKTNNQLQNGGCFCGQSNAFFCWKE